MRHKLAHNALGLADPTVAHRFARREHARVGVAGGRAIRMDLNSGDVALGELLRVHSTRCRTALCNSHLASLSGVSEPPDGLLFFFLVTPKAFVSDYKEYMSARVVAPFFERAGVGEKSLFHQSSSVASGRGCSSGRMLEQLNPFCMFEKIQASHSLFHKFRSAVALSSVSYALSAKPRCLFTHTW